VGSGLSVKLAREGHGVSPPSAPEQVLSEPPSEILPSYIQHMPRDRLSANMASTPHIMRSLFNSLLLWREGSCYRKSLENSALRCPKGGDSGSGTGFLRRQWASHSQPKAGHFHGLSLGMETKSWHSTDWLQFFLHLVRHKPRLIKLRATSWISLPMAWFHKMRRLCSRHGKWLAQGRRLVEAKMGLEATFQGSQLSALYTTHKNKCWLDSYCIVRQYDDSSR